MQTPGSIENQGGEETWRKARGRGEGIGVEVGAKERRGGNGGGVEVGRRLETLVFRREGEGDVTAFI
ncbi:hypothetical protein BHM03_00023519, partial [Ensete ventricosum]